MTGRQTASTSGKRNRTIRRKFATALNLLCDQLEFDTTLTGDSLAVNIHSLTCSTFALPKGLTDGFFGPLPDFGHQPWVPRLPARFGYLGFHEVFSGTLGDIRGSRYIEGALGTLLRIQHEWFNQGDDHLEGKRRIRAPDIGCN